MTDLLQFTINVRKSHRQPQCTLQLVCEDCVLFVWVDLHVSLCGQQHPSWERATRPVIHLSIPNFALHRLHKQKSNGVRSVGSNSCISVTIQNWTYVHMHFFFRSQWPILSPRKILTFAPDSLCMRIVIYFVLQKNADFLLALWRFP
jgi:hypothetical protein